MDIPHCPNYSEFRTQLYRLFYTNRCELDIDAASKWLNVDRSTLYRWINGRQRIPHTAWALVWLISSGELPNAHGWHGWLFKTRWDHHTQRHIHRLVSPNGDEYTGNEILAWHFKSQQRAALERRLNELTNTRDTVLKTRRSA